MISMLTCRSGCIARLPLLSKRGSYCRPGSTRSCCSGAAAEKLMIFMWDMQVWTYRPVALDEQARDLWQARKYAQALHLADTFFTPVIKTIHEVVVVLHL
jgi:hypothetical protein